MTTPLISEVIGDLTTYIADPTAAISTGFNLFSQITGGVDAYADAGNPFAFMMEFSAATAAAAANEAYVVTRQLYPSLASDMSELVRHMADTDFVGIYASPASVSQMYFSFNYTEVITNMVYDSATESRYLTIPRNTTVTVGGVTFSLQYPVIIRQLNDQSIQIQYDTSVVSPLRTIDQNSINYSVIRRNGTAILIFVLEMDQFFVKSAIASVSVSASLPISITLTDSFYYARVYTQNSDSTWTEIATTHTQDIFDPTVPTAYIQVNETDVTVKIPNIYAANGTVSGRVRCDIYQTKGNISLNLGAISQDSYAVNFYSIDQNESNAYTTAIQSLKEVTIFSSSVASNGRNALTFDQVRERVMNGAYRARGIPISSADITATGQDQNYTITKKVDTVTGRQFLASRALPSPTADTLYTAAGAGMLKLYSTLAFLDQAHGVNKTTVGYTATDEALLQYNNGVTEFVTETAYATLIGLSNTDKAAAFNQGEYFYSPFCYAIDLSTDTLSVNAFYMAAPYIDRMDSIGTAVASGSVVDVASSSYINRSPTGFQLVINTISDSNYKGLQDASVGCQISFKPAGATSSYSLKGTLQSRANVTDERVFIFELKTLMDIDLDFNLLITSMYSGSAITPARAALSQKFDIIFTALISELDADVSAMYADKINTALFGPGYAGIAYTTAYINFGKHMDRLWQSYRAVAGNMAYKKYAVDVPQVYPTDVYGADSSGAIVTVVGGNVVYNKLHSAGDPVILDGVQQYRHRAGDLILDDSGNPIPTDDYAAYVDYYIDIYVLNAVYRFASDTITSAYRTAFTAALVDYIIEDVPALDDMAIDQSEVFYYPQESEGYVTVTTQDNLAVSLPAAQSLAVTVYLTDENMNNASLKASLEATVIRTIGDYLSSNTVISRARLNKKLLDTFGTNVISIDVRGFGGASDYVLMTLNNSGSRLGLNKVMVVRQMARLR